MQNVSSTEPRTIQASEAKTHFLRILDEVEQGQSVLVTRHGRTVARIEPVQETDEARHERRERAFQGILELRKRTKGISIEQILADRDEGRA
jgi:prevent-host-death family protein